MRTVMTAIGVVAALVISAVRSDGQSGSLKSIDAVLDAARHNVARYERESAAVICEESYSQQVWGPRKIGAGPWETALIEQRQLASDFLVVWVPSAATWMGFRDVRAVDGRPVRDGAVRFETLLRKSDASLASVKALADESSRFNIGPAERNFNEPTHALRVLDPANTARFEFQRDGTERVGDVAAWRIQFREIARPTLIQRAQRDVPAHGLLWIDPAQGLVVRTELRVEDPASGAQAKIVVDYGPDARLGVWIPRRMSEVYDGGAMTVKGIADYSHFRRFETSGRLLLPK
jgi:hypothetical protein